MQGRRESETGGRRLSPGKWELVVLTLLVLLVAGGGGWAWLARIEGAVIANGAVSPQSGIKIIQHRDGGVVKEIRVREGDAVRKGDILIILKDETLRANHAITRAGLDVMLAEIARLEAEQSGAEEVIFPPELRERETAESASKAMKAQRALFRARRDALAGQKRVLGKKIEAQKKLIEGLAAQLESTGEQIRITRERTQTVEAEYREGRATRPRLLDLKSRLAGLEGEKGRLTGEIARARESIAEIRMGLIQLDEDFRAKVLSTLAERMTAAGSLREKLTALEEKLAAAEIRAPVDGRVLNLTVRTIGGVIMQGRPIMQIVPAHEPLVIEAQVQPQDIAHVHAGQKARINFTAFSSRTTPTLNGRVRTVSAAPVTNGPRRQPYYLAEVVVPVSELERLGKNRQLVAGMQAAVYMTTESRRPLNILLAPLTKVTRNALRGYR